MLGHQVFAEQTVEDILLHPTLFNQAVQNVLLAELLPLSSEADNQELPESPTKIEVLDRWPEHFILLTINNVLRAWGNLSERLSLQVVSQHCLNEQLKWYLGPSSRKQNPPRPLIKDK